MITLPYSPTARADTPSPDPGPLGRGGRWTFAALWLVILLALAVQFAWPLAALPFHISWNNNEGWNAYWTARALSGLPLYTDAASPISNNYPPLSFYIVGGFGRLIGDPIIAGRIICLGSLLATAVLIERIIARFGGSRLWGAAAAAIFLLNIATVAQRYLVADDPQWLAEAPMVASLLFLIGHDRDMPSRRRLIAACLLMLLSGLIKHNQIALPLAATVWLAIYDRRGLAVWLATAAIAGGVALAALALIYGYPFFDQVLHHQRIINAKLLGGAIHSVSYTFPEMLLAGALACSRPRDPRLALLLLFAPIAVLIGIFERLGVGVSQNAHFDGAIALMILAGIILSRGMIGLRSPWLRLAILAVMIAPLAARVARKAPQNVREALVTKQTDARWQQAIALLARQPGPVACERPALCYWSGKPYALDVSNYGQKLRKGHDPIGLKDQIARKQIGAFVELRDNRYMAGRGRLPDDFYRLMESRYRVAQILPDDLYIVIPAD